MYVSLTHVLPNIECIFSAFGIFQFGKPIFAD